MFATSEERQPTNRGAAIFSFILVSILVGIFIYCQIIGDISRFINGYDDCGNVCGKANPSNSITYCGSNDKTKYKFTLWNGTIEVDGNTFHRSQCVENCKDYEGYQRIGSRCVPIATTNETRSIMNEIAEYLPDDLTNSWKYILISSVVAAVFSFIILVLFRYVIKQIIWGIYIGLIIGMEIACVALIIAHFKTTDTEVKKSYGLLISAAIFGIVGLVMGIALYFFRKRIQLVIEIFKETAKVLSDAPGLLFQPFATFITLLISFALFIYFILVIQSSGKLTELKTSSGQFLIAYYKIGFINVIGHILNFIIFYWFTMFIYGCQHFIIASAVSQWYFTRDKNKLDSPQAKGFKHLLKYHIGSICFGSYLIMLVKIVLGILRGLASDSDNSNPALIFMKSCFRYILDMVEKLLEFLLRNSYIIIALEGTGLVPSGKRAVKLLKDNLVDVIALNQFGDIVMVVARIFIALLAGTLCWSLVTNRDEIYLKWAPVVIAVIIGYFIIHCFMAVFEMGVDTVFICFCVDYEKNDGGMSPYFMSPNLMEAMKTIKEHAGGEFSFGTSQNSNTRDPQQPVYVTNVQPNHPFMQQPYYQNNNYPAYPQSHNYPHQNPYQQYQPSYPNQNPQHPYENKNIGFNV